MLLIRNSLGVLRYIYGNVSDNLILQEKQTEAKKNMKSMKSMKIRENSRRPRRKQIVKAIVIIILVKASSEFHYHNIGFKFKE